MTPSGGRSGPDWLAVCRRAAEAARAAVERQGTVSERAVEMGRGEGGDTTLAVDQAAEDAIFAELDAVGEPLTAISEERGEVRLAGGSRTTLVIDPVDGSLNAKRGLPHASVSIAVADGDCMADVFVGYVAELASPAEWWALRGEGAFAGGRRLPRLEPGPVEIFGLETARPRLVAEAAPAIAALEAHRVRSLGSVAVTLCLLAEGKLDAMAGLRQVRSVDVAAGQLIVREAGGETLLPEAGERAPLALDMRSRVVAARDRSTAHAVLDVFGGGLRS
jgi:myo-inositol-1(or 4)-monophosphatase